jgi:PAS domain S-box-containing protein
MSFNGISRFWYLPALWFGGSLALGLVTWVCYRAGSILATTELAYLLVIVLVSTLDSVISSLILSVVAVGCLNYFFIEPLFSFQINAAGDGFALAVFGITSLVITGLVRRVRDLGGAHRERAQLIDLTHDTIIVRDIGDVIIDWNRGAELLYGWTKAEAVGKRARALLRTDASVPLDEIMSTVLRTGQWAGELDRSKRDGTGVIVSSRWALRRDEHGMPTGTLETSNDVTEYRRAQELLRRSQAVFLAEAQKLSLTGSFGWEASTGDISWSEESSRIFAYDTAQKPSIDLILQRVHPDDVGEVRRTIERGLSDRTDFDIEHRLLLPDGTIKHLHLIARVVLNEPNRLQFAGAIRDVTAAKHAEDRWQRAQSELAYVTRVSALGQMAASIAHEINQPLTAIVTSGYACLRWLDRDVPQPAEASAAVRRMIENGKRASDVVQGIRALARKSGPQRVELNLNDIVADIIPLVQREMLEHRVSPRLDLAPGLPRVLGDRVQLQQVIINFVINAVQSMATVTDRPRRLVIRSEQTDAGDVRLAVEDSGAGIAVDSESRLWDAFFSTKPDGMGMGLAISRSIIEAHGGRVWAGPSAGGPGATFWFALPPPP